MEPGKVRIRAVIFDVYGTLLQVGPPPADATQQWIDLFEQTFRSPPRLQRLEFSVACNRVIVRRHTSARERGIAFPEVQWPTVVAEVLPESARLDAPAREEFLYRLIQTGHTTRLASAAAATLRLLLQRHCRLGIASNAQAYTWRELRQALTGAGLDLAAFDPKLCFWSFDHGFSKPDPHAFRILSARLEAYGIGPAETLMVGDLLDNDIIPARAHGWRAWHLRNEPAETMGGDWARLQAWLDSALQPPFS